VTTYAKVKSASKLIIPRSEALERKVLETLDTIASIVGATLGPGGAPVLLERQDFGLPPLVTKDGVTVFQALGFDDPVSHAIMESMRDAALKTASEAGDGTTTATVLSWAIVLYVQQYRHKHPEVPVQRIAERLRDVFEDKLLPAMEKLSRDIDYSTDAGKKLVRAVATISANGDEKLADAVMECFDLVGDQGTVAISEKSGKPSYQVEKIEGFPVPIGYEDSCARFMQAFMNDPGNGRVIMRKPYFILYNGVITDVQSVFSVLDRMQGAYLNRPSRGEAHNPEQPFIESPNIVLVAHGFSEQVLGTLAINFNNPEAIRTLPLVTPRSSLQNGEAHFLDDLAAVTGATVFDLTQQKGLDSAVIPGEGEPLDCDIGTSDEFEMLRWRSTVIGKFDSDLVADRAAVLEQMAASAISELDGRMIRDRLAALTGGIAKLWVIGSSQGELRERKDRADDAVRAVQGATKSGVLPAAAGP
jgi:chaperonin GroEL